MNRCCAAPSAPRPHFLLTLPLGLVVRPPHRAVLRVLSLTLHVSDGAGGGDEVHGGGHVCLAVRRWVSLDGRAKGGEEGAAQRQLQRRRRRRSISDPSASSGLRSSSSSAAGFDSIRLGGTRINNGQRCHQWTNRHSTVRCSVQCGVRCAERIAGDGGAPRWDCGALHAIALRTTPQTRQGNNHAHTRIRYIDKS